MATDTKDGETSLFEGESGSRVFFGLEDEPVSGTRKDVERIVPTDDYPSIGEEVTFRSLNGDVKHRVAEVDSSREDSVQFEHGGWYGRHSIVEYSETELFRVIELDNGQELFPAEGEGP